MKDMQSNMDALMTKSGIDLKSDIDSMILVIAEEYDFKAKDIPEFYTVITGTFNKDKIYSAIKAEAAEGVEEKTIDGYPVLYTRSSFKGESEAYIYFHNGSTIVFANGYVSMLTGLKTVNAKMGNLSKNPQLLSKYEAVNRGHTAWGILTIPSLKSDVAGSGMFDIFDDINGVYFGITMSKSDSEIDIQLFVPSKDKIEKYGYKVKGFTGDGKEQRNGQSKNAGFPGFN